LKLIYPDNEDEEANKKDLQLLQYSINKQYVTKADIYVDDINNSNGKIPLDMSNVKITKHDNKYIVERDAHLIFGTAPYLMTICYRDYDLDDIDLKSIEARTINNKTIFFGRTLSNNEYIKLNKKL
jgi:hypothetical protein